MTTRDLFQLGPLFITNATFLRIFLQHGGVSELWHLLLFYLLTQIITLASCQILRWVTYNIEQISNSFTILQQNFVQKYTQISFSTFSCFCYSLLSFLFVYSLNSMPLFYYRFILKHLVVFKYRLSQTKFNTFRQVQCQLSSMSLVIFISCAETYESPPSHLEILRFSLFKNQIYSMFLDFQFVKRRQPFPKHSIIEQKPSIIRVTCSAMTKQNNLNSFDLYLASKKESIVDEQRWRIKFIPCQQSLKIGSCDFIGQIFFTMHTRHIIDDFFLVEMLSNEDSCAWYFGCGFINLCKLIEQSSFSSIWKTDYLYPFYKIILDMFFQCFDSLFACAGNHHYFDIFYLLQNRIFFTSFTVRNKFLHPLPDYIQNEMFIQILMIDYVYFVYHYTELDILSEQFIKYKFFKTASYVQYIDHVHEKSWHVFMLFQDFIQQHF